MNVSLLLSGVNVGTDECLFVQMFEGIAWYGELQRGREDEDLCGGDWGEGKENVRFQHDRDDMTCTQGQALEFTGVS